MSKPREFWIDDITLKICGPWSDVTSGQMAWPDNEKVIHVIEKSHADKLEVTLKEAAQTLEWIQSGVSGMFNDGEDKDKLIFDQAARTIARIEEALK